MAKDKSGSEVEYLRGIVRKLRSENKNLKKRLSSSHKKNSKLEGMVESLPDPDVIEIEVIDTETKAICPKCGKYKEFDIIAIGNRFLHKCDDCGYRKTVKHNG